jgi:D-glycero-D-manno-heptose 1,7-bisphosphate phosphatase
MTTARPEQAAILCGGRGERLRPLTDRLPKPMAPVNGRPFLAYLIEQLRDQGLRRILLLTGYRGEALRACFGDGRDFDVDIEYSHGPADWETGRRIREAASQLDARFCLLYGDNYAPFSLDKLSAFHDARRPAVTLTLRPKARGNIRMSDDAWVDAYDSTRAGDGLDYVEIGYMLAQRDETLAAIDGANPSFTTALAALAARRRLAGLAGIAGGDGYHSISDLDRLRLAERYLAVKRVVLIDRDGTINQRPPRGQYVTCWDEFRWIDDAVAGMRWLADRGFWFVVISNQAGIGRGLQDAAAVADINERMTAELRGQGIDVRAVYVCPHHWEDGCDCRKPAPGLFHRCSREHVVRLDRAVYVGDDPRDCVAAHNAGCVSVLVGPERDVPTATGEMPAFTAETLLSAAPRIAERFEAWESAARQKVLSC